VEPASLHGQASFAGLKTCSYVYFHVNEGPGARFHKSMRNPRWVAVKPRRS
jgi:hypothetical protein